MTQGKMFSSKNRLFVAMLLAAVLVPLGVSLRAQDLEWAKRAGGASSDGGRSIAVDGTGNSYVTGSFRVSAIFGPGEANQTTLTSAGIGLIDDIFVAKYAANGALLWAKRAGGPDFDRGLGIAVDGAGNSYVTGFFRNSATFGSGEANQTTLNSPGFNDDIFVAKYAADGALLWAKRAGGTDFDQGLGIAVDGAGNSYVTGRFRDSATFGPGEANETTLTSAGFEDLFVAQYDANGALLWARRAGGTSFDEGFGIAVDGAGNSYVTGSFSGSATFGPGEANQTTLTSAGSADLFVAQYAANGTLLWARRAGGTDSDEGFGIAVDGTGNSYVTGAFSGSATFGPGEANQTTLTSAGSADLFVAKYAANGTLLWAKRAGGTDFEEGLGIAVDGTGNSYITGRFRGSATFGPGEANQTPLTSAGSADLFVAQYAANGALLWAKRAGGTNFDEGFGIAVDGAGNSYVTGVFFGSATFGPGEANQTTLNSAGVEDLFVAKFQGAAPVTPFVLLANKVTLKRTKQATPAGDIHSNGTLTVEKGDPSTYNSNLTAVGKITIQKDNTINGDVTSGTSISNSGTITGTKTIAPVDTEDLPSLSYSAGGANKTVPSGGTLAVAPGSYNIVTLNSGGTLKLTSGEYFMNELRYSGSEAVIEIDLSSGEPVTINVVSKLQLGKEAALRLLPNGEGDSELVTFNTLQSSAVSFGKEAYLLGRFNAPNAVVTLVKNSQLRGAICAKEILVERDCLFLHHDSPGSLPGPGNLPKSSFDEEEVTSDQSSVISDYALEQNYPNPFNPSTVISFQLPEASEVSLSIFNTNGQLVKQVASGKFASGRHTLVWDATDDRGGRVASGVYLYVIKAGEFTAQRKLVLMK